MAILLFYIIKLNKALNYQRSESYGDMRWYAVKAKERK